MQGAEIKSTRELLGLTQVQFAQLLGVHPITVSKWERDVSPPTPYQNALFLQFQLAARNKEITETLAGVLISMGVIVALALLLKHLTK
jgi:transcriptional regulator with XRE-family HTH domain